MPTLKDKVIVALVALLVLGAMSSIVYGLYYFFGTTAAYVAATFFITTGLISSAYEL